MVDAKKAESYEFIVCKRDMYSGVFVGDIFVVDRNFFIRKIRI